MILATDTHYPEQGARTAGILFRAWSDAAPASTLLVESDTVADYEPGSFYKRELPLIMKLLKTLSAPPEVIVIDGYVTLDEAGRKGLGSHLYDALGGEVQVIGVAKNTFKGSPHAVALLRGESLRPLYVTAAGLDKEEAAACIKAMHGEHRRPTLLMQVDGLCRRGE